MKLLHKIYRIAKRLFILDVNRLLVAEQIPFTAGEFEYRAIDRAEHIALSKDESLGLDIEMASRLEQGLDYCFVAFQQDRVAGYCWVALQNIEAEHNRGDHPLTGVAMSFPANTAFIYKAFTNPEFRGQSVFPRLLGFSARHLKSREINVFVSTTDWTNAAALRAFVKSGFDDVGPVSYTHLTLPTTPYV